MARANYNYLTYEPLKVDLGAAPDWMFNAKWPTFNDVSQDVSKTQLMQAQAQAAEQQMADAEQERQVVQSLKEKYSDPNVPLNLDSMLNDLAIASVKGGDLKTGISALAQKRQYQQMLAEAEKATRPKSQLFSNGASWQIDPTTGEASYTPGPEKPKQTTARSRLMIFDTPGGGKVVGNLYDKTTQDAIASGDYIPQKSANPGDVLAGMLGIPSPQEQLPAAEDAPSFFSRLFGGHQAAKSSELQPPSGDPVGTKKRGRDGKTYVKTAQGYTPER